ncbi:hypothetical protein ECC02_004657 [Trypanosoma cruzi]|uniref:Uncharacterized protein n=1 Tax=Trypanosoma cruzi TaxID=5693 RepID=A0A7J6Y7F2_TRYCR|nr:hypothetical protein ECC02_004657 [Trypanosoma cruzi]
MSVPLAMGPKGGYRKKIRIPKDERRLGPWYAPFGSDAPKTDAVTPTTTDATHFPVFEGKLILRSTAPFTPQGERKTVNPIKQYDPREDDEEDEEQEKEAEEEEEENDTQKETVKRSRLELQGFSFLEGAVFEPLSRATVRHCVFGRSEVEEKANKTQGSDVPLPSPLLETTVTAHPLTEVQVEFCVIYGNQKHGIYAFPRCALRFHSSMIIGPQFGVVHETQDFWSRAARHAQKNTSSQSVPRSRRPLQQAKIPEKTLCAVGVYLDDADVSIQDVFVAQSHVGILLVNGCRGTSVIASRVESISSVGILFSGEDGAAKIKCSAVRWCGRECLLVKGPVPPLPPDPSLLMDIIHDAFQDAEAGKGEEQEEEEEEEEEDTAARALSRVPIPTQHPILRGNAFDGSVRLEGDVSSAAMCDNVIYVAKEGISPDVPTFTGPAAEKRFALKGFHVHVRGTTPRKNDSD